MPIVVGDTLGDVRFGIRAASVEDAPAIARVHTDSWQTSYRGILPDSVLDQIDVGQRRASRERILTTPGGLHLVAFDVSSGEIVGFCDAGPSRSPGYDGEVYAIYFAHRAKRYGLGTEMFDQVRDWLPSRNMHSMIVWVLANNPHARRFYEAVGGRTGHTKQTRVDRFPVIEQAYLWDRI
ncbi:MAG: GNAT family N-acetyltransferase [Kofleriaceae bacterium]